MSDNAALVTFYQGWADTHVVSKDGFPAYTDTIMVSIDRPPLLHLERVATKDDFRDHPEEFAAFQAIAKARRNTGEDGYPLVYWPAATAAEVKMLAVRNISTVEDLAKLAGNRDIPGQLADLALRAERMLDMQKDFGKYEALLNERDAENEVLAGQVKDLQQSLSAANALIETMKINRVA